MTNGPTSTALGVGAVRQTVGPPWWRGNAVDAGFGYQGWKSLTNPDVYLLSGFATPRPRAKRIWRPE